MDAKEQYRKFQSALVFDAAHDLLAEAPPSDTVAVGLPHISATALVERSGVPRASLYRLFPKEAGSSVVEQLFERTLSVCSDARSSVINSERVAQERDGVERTYEDVAVAGLTSIFSSFAANDFVSKVLGRHELVTSTIVSARFKKFLSMQLSLLVAPHKPQDDVLCVGATEIQISAAEHCLLVDESTVANRLAEFSVSTALREEARRFTESLDLGETPVDFEGMLSAADTT